MLLLNHSEGNGIKPRYTLSV